MQPVPTWHDLGLHHHRQPEIRRLAHGFSGKAGRSYADDGERGLNDANGSAQHIRFSAKTPLPIVVADHHFRVLSRSHGSIWVEKAADRRLHAENTKVVF